MSLNLIAINVGNTRTQFAAFAEGEREGPIERLGHDELPRAADTLRQLRDRIEPEDLAVYVASVNPEAAKETADIAVRTLDAETAHVGEDVTVPVGRQLDREAIVGVDRLLNVAAAYDRIKQACIIIDAGTAVTVDFVDGEGTFHGGAILPGARMSLDILHDYTHQLPRIEFAPPVEAVGHNTVEAMRSGVYHGLRGAVRELAERFALFYGAYPKIIATGGDAHTLFEDYELVEAVVDDLTLRGIAVTHRVACGVEE